MKKNENIFTVKFDPYLAEHKKAIEVLNSVGRKKASLIATAISYYMDKDKEPSKDFEMPEQELPKAEPKEIIEEDVKEEVMEDFGTEINTPEEEKPLEEPNYSEILSAINSFGEWGEE